MPPRLPARAHDLRKLATEPYICASCLGKAANGTRKPAFEQQRTKTGLHRRLTNVSNGGRMSQRFHRVDPPSRHASNGGLASVTAVNAPTTVPAANRDLYRSLSALQETASSYVDLSRLQLAMRSLESEAPVLRVALLGVGNNGAFAARKLARALLSDALSDEQEWEREILESAKDGRSLLIRYGDVEQPAQSNALIRTIFAASPYLMRHNLEILVTTCTAGAGLSDPGAVEEAVLVPSLTTPSSAEGRVGFVRYPVHKAVLVAEGVTGAVEYGRFPDALTKGALIDAALSVPLRKIPATVVSKEEQASSKAVDADLAQHALDLFRADKANGAVFSDEWQTSRISVLSEWITSAYEQKEDSTLPSPVQDLIISILSNSSTSISVAEDAERSSITANTVPDAKRASLQSAISQWSAAAHRDLQDNLDTALQTSRSWRRTVWWRLFWRIDDVTVSAADILQRSWLTEAEQQLAFLSGRIYDSGLATPDQLSGPSPMLLSEVQQAEMADYEAHKAQTETVAELKQLPAMLSQIRQQSGINPAFLPPWPQTINFSRQFMLRTLVPDLHRKAQALLVTTLTTIGGSSALGAWFYAATAGHGLYESGAVVALGFVWSLRRLQKKWGRKREEFAGSVREDARRVLGEVDAQLRGVVREGGRGKVRAEDEREWVEAREAVNRCLEAMEKRRSKGEN